MIELVTLVVLALASYRITRILVIDSLFDGSRTKFHSFLLNRQGKSKVFWEKIYELTSCTWCAGVWVSFLLYSIYVWQNPTNFTRLDWISGFAVAGVQGLLHTFEADEG